MNTALKTGLLAIATLAFLHCGSADAMYDDEAESQDTRNDTPPRGADGDSCSIDRNGLETTGITKGTQCCNVLDSKDCVDLPTTTTTTKGATPVLLPPTGASRVLGR